MVRSPEYRVLLGDWHVLSTGSMAYWLQWLTFLLVHLLVVPLLTGAGVLFADSLLRLT